MKIINRTKFINLLLIIGMVILTVCGFLAYHQVQELIRANQKIVHTHQIIGIANNTHLALVEADYKLDYYKLIPNDAFLNDIPTYLEAAKTNAKKLTLITENEEQLQKAKELELQVLILTNVMDQILQQLRNKTYKFTKEAGIYLQKLNGEIDDKILIFNQGEESLLLQRNNVAIQETAKSNILFLIFGIISEIIIILSFILFNQNIHVRAQMQRKQLETEKELLESNKKLKESEQQYLLAVEGSSSGIWDWEVGTDKVYFSPYYKKMLGYTDEEFPDNLQSFEKNVHPTDHNRVWQIVDQHLKNHAPFKVAYRLRCKSGVYRWFQAQGQALWDEKGNPIRMSGSIVDITDAKKNDQKLAIQFGIAEILSENVSLKEIANNIVKLICEELGWEYSALWMVNQEEQKLNCIGVWNQPSSLINLFKEESLHIKFKRGEGLPGDVWRDKKSLWITNLSKYKNFFRAKTAKKVGLHSGMAFPILLQKEVLGVMEFFSSDYETPDEDISNLLTAVCLQIGQFLSREKSEHDLRESEAYKSAILQSASDSILTLDEENNIISCNLKTTNEFKFTQDELLNKNISTILPDFHLNLADLADKPSIETTGKRENGDTFPVEIKISKMDVLNKTRYVIIIRNVTERKKIEQIKNEFISVVSHELRTPLTSIRGALGLIMGGAVGTLSDESKKLLNIASNNSERLLLLINDILDIEKLEAGMMTFHYQVKDITQVVKEALDANKLFADKYNITLEFNQSLPELKVNVDPDRLMQVLTNLISNAVKFSPSGDKVTLQIEEYQDKVRVLVINRGVGIPKDFQNKIFKRFSQADTSDTRGKGGTGLGLNISKVIIEKLGGTINFYSKPNDVTTFYFDLPLVKTKLEQSKEHVDTLDAKNRILICEDDFDQANYLSKLLEGSGYIIDIAGTVNEANSFLNKFNYYVLLLDLILPDHDGISFIRELRNAPKTHDLPIIVISIFAQTGRTLLNEADFSVTAWLDKPLDFNKLLNAMNQIKPPKMEHLPNILYVEDNLEQIELLKSHLQSKANITIAASLKETLEQLKKNPFDLVIMNLIMPDGNTEELLPMISQYHYPIIVYSDKHLNNQYQTLVKHHILKSESSLNELLNLINFEIKPRK